MQKSKAFQKRLAGCAALMALCGAATSVCASVIPTSVTASGLYSGDLGVLTDGVIPPNRTAFDDPKYTVSFDYEFSTTEFTFNFDGAQSVSDMLESVDNNDRYTTTFYNGSKIVATFVIPPSAGVETSGLETFSTDKTSSYSFVPGFMPVTATSAVVTASGPDYYYGIGEVQFLTGTQGVSAAPEPGAWALMLGGVAVLGTVLRRQRSRRGPDQLALAVSA